uniref:hypothetical protein n=1 Tax=Neisseria sicca TaxID=490 RepID=UPI001C995C5D
ETVGMKRMWGEELKEVVEGKLVDGVGGVGGEMVDVKGVGLGKKYGVFCVEVMARGIEGKMEDVMEWVGKYVDIRRRDLKGF